MSLMVFNVVKILEIETGTELNRTVYDQWVRVSYKDHYLSIFDMDMLASVDAVGDFHEVKISVMFTELARARRLFVKRPGAHLAVR